MYVNDIIESTDSMISETVANNHVVCCYGCMYLVLFLACIIGLYYIVSWQAYINCIVLSSFDSKVPMSFLDYTCNVYIQCIHVL